MAVLSQQDRDGSNRATTHGPWLVLTCLVSLLEGAGDLVSWLEVGL